MDESVLLLIQGILNNPKAITEYKLRINPQKRSQALFHFVAKPGGLWTTILGMFSIQVSTTITITPQEVMHKTVSMGGTAVDVFPLKQVASMHIASISRAPIVTSMIFIAVLTLIGTVTSTLVDAKSSLIPLVAGGMIMLVLFIAYLVFGRRFGFSIVSTSGARFHVFVKAGRVGNQDIDADKIEYGLMILRDLIMAGATASPMSSESDGEETPAYAEVADDDDDDDEPEYAAPAVAASGGTAFSFDSPSAQSDPETEARDLFKKGADLFKAGNKKEAISTWERVVRLYPNTQAGQAAVRNLEKLR